MKKKLLAMALCLCTVFSVAACGNGEDDKKDVKTEAELKLGEYKGIKVNTTLGTVTEEDIQQNIEYICNAKYTTEEIKDAIVLKEGDVAKLSYKCIIDGEEYSTETGVYVQLTENGFDVDGFVDGIIGKTVGDKVSLELKLADDIVDEKVAGKDATFEIDLEAKVNVIIPEYTDEFVAENFNYMGITTTDEFTKYVERQLLITQLCNEIWQEIIDNSTVVSYDSDELVKMTDKYIDYQEYNIYDKYKCTLDEYLSLLKMDRDDFEKEMEDLAKEYLKQVMICEAIAEAENIVVTDELYDKKMLEMAKSYGYETTEEFLEDYQDDTREDYEFAFLSELVQEFVCDNVEYVDDYKIRFEHETESSSEKENSSDEKDSSSSEEESTSAATK